MPFQMNPATPAVTVVTAPHLKDVCSVWLKVRHGVVNITSSLFISGDRLTIADVVAVALHEKPVFLDASPFVRQRIQRSVDILAAKLDVGEVIYGVNTGFGGSADTRTQDHRRLQSALLQHLNVGILLPSDKKLKVPGCGRSRKTNGADSTLPAPRLDLLLHSHALPVAIVRAMMLVRANSLARGHSAVREEVVDALLHLLRNNLTPVVPLRGSISASGDLSTLSYVAAAIEGHPDVYMRAEYVDKTTGEPVVRYTTADEGLSAISQQPVRLQAKEGLGITNGTAPSCATACLAVYTANQLAVWTQFLTAMATEALQGTSGNYDPFLASARPHTGQREVCSNIRQFLQGSKLVPDKGSYADSLWYAKGPLDTVRACASLAQDRYALRTAPQWIGPLLEDLVLATQQVRTELNATTDNPLIDPDTQTVHHGGNFQAMSITSAMEKTMSALQSMGRLLHAQSAELVDNARNFGLPPNLSIDDPSTSFLCKGFDVNMAAYQAELAYLAHPVSSHAQVAEMANQSVNSMALVAARYALEATELVSLMVATHLFMLCQALDLRCMRNQILESVSTSVCTLVDELLPLPPLGSQLESEPAPDLRTVKAAVMAKVADRWDATAHLDARLRAETTARDAVGTLLSSTQLLYPVESFPDGAALANFKDRVCGDLLETHGLTRRKFLSDPAPAREFLSPATNTVYEFVRLELRIPLHRGVDTYRTLAVQRQEQGEEKGDTRILGTMASEIYMALQDGRLMDRLSAYCTKTNVWA